MRLSRRPSELDTPAAYWLRQASIALISTVTIMFIVPLWSIAHDPSLLVRDWDPWGWFIVLPYTVATVMLVIARRLRRNANIRANS